MSSDRQTVSSPLSPSQVKQVLYFTETLTHLRSLVCGATEHEPHLDLRLVEVKLMFGKCIEAASVAGGALHVRARSVLQEPSAELAYSILKYQHPDSYEQEIRIMAPDYRAATLGPLISRARRQLTAPSRHGLDGNPTKTDDSLANKLKHLSNDTGIAFKIVRKRLRKKKLKPILAQLDAILFITRNGVEDSGEIYRYSHSIATGLLH